MTVTAHRKTPKPALVRRAVLTAVRRDPGRFASLLDSFSLRDAWQRERTSNVLAAFLAGYNGFAKADDPARVHDDLAGIERYYRPFGYEGAGMGFGPWAYLTGHGYQDFDAVMTGFHAPTVYQNYVGLGWWLATRPPVTKPRTSGVTAALQVHFRLLPYEGMGFRAGFLGAGRTAVTRRFARTGPAAAHVCHQGYGRSLWFVCMGDLARARALIAALPETVHGDCYSGLGLGFAYSWLDRADQLTRVLGEVPDGHRASFLQGAAFGWEARQLADRPLFDELVALVEPWQQAHIAASLAAVAAARNDLDARGETESFYQLWRAETHRRLPSI